MDRRDPFDRAEAEFLRDVTPAVAAARRRCVARTSEPTSAPAQEARPLVHCGTAVVSRLVAPPAATRPA